MLYFCLWRNRSIRTKFELSISVLRIRTNEGWVCPSTWARCRLLKQHLHRLHMLHHTQRRGKGEPVTGEVMLGSALVYTVHIFSLLNQYWTLMVEGRWRRVTQLWLFFFLLTQNLEVRLLYARSTLCHRYYFFQREKEPEKERERLWRILLKEARSM